MNSRYVYLSVYLARFVYGLNWFSTSTTLPFISESLHLDPLQTGFIGTAFYLGLIPFQFIGGAIASQFGPKRTAVAGLAVMGVFSIPSAYSSSFFEISLFRFFTGSGAAMFSSPALALIGNLSLTERRASITGLYNTSFGVGSGAGILMGILFAYPHGWADLLALDGALGLVMSIIVYVSTMKISFKSNGTGNIRGSARRFFSGKVYFLSVSAAISTIAEAVIGQEFVYYSSIRFGLPEAYSAITVASFMLTGLAGGTILSRHFDNSRSSFRYYASLVVLESALFLVMPLAISFLTSLILISLMGILTSACLSILYSLVMKSGKREDSSMYLGLNNFIQKIVSFSTPALFIFLGTLYGFTFSWDILGIAGIAAFLIFAVNEKFEPVFSTGRGIQES